MSEFHPIKTHPANRMQQPRSPYINLSRVVFSSSHPPRHLKMSTTMASTSAPPSPPQSQPVWRTWRSWDSVAVVLVGIPRDANTYLLWKAFQNEGNIMSIDIFDDRHGKRSSKGKIRFRYVFIAFIYSPRNPCYSCFLYTANLMSIDYI